MILRWVFEMPLLIIKTGLGLFVNSKYILRYVLVLVLWEMILIRDYSFSDILLCTSIASFSGWQSIPIYFILAFTIALIKVLSCAILILGAAIEIVKHKIHVFSLFSLEMVLDVLISVNFYFYMCVSLPWKCSWLCKSSVIYLVVWFVCLSLTSLELLFLLRVITDIECFSASCLNSTWARCLCKRLSLKVSIISSGNISRSHSLNPPVGMKSLLILNQVCALCGLVLRGTWTRIIKIIRGYSKFMPSCSSFTIHPVRTWSLILSWIRVEISIYSIIYIDSPVLILCLKTRFFIEPIFEVCPILSYILRLILLLSVLLLILI